MASTRRLPAALLAVLTGCVSKPAVTREAAPADCVVSGRLGSISAVYADPTAQRVLFGVVGTQQVEAVSPPDSYGRPVDALLSWPVVGRVWLESERVFAVRERIALPELGMAIVPEAYLASVRRTGPGRARVRLELGEEATPPFVEHDVSCAELTLGRFARPRPPGASPGRRVFLTHDRKVPVQVPLRLAPAAAPVATLALFSTRVVEVRDGWAHVSDERGALAYEGWIPAELVPPDAEGSGALGIGGLRASAFQAERRERPKTAARLELRLKPDRAEPPVAVLAKGVPIKVLEERDGFVRVALEPLNRTGTARMDDEGFYVVAGSPGLPAPEPAR